VRTFIAIDLPKELKEKIFTYARRLAGGINIKLVEKENLHLTLLFLGEMAEEEKERVMKVLGPPAGGLGGLGKINLRLGKAEIFPDKKRPRGIWINVEGEKEKLFSLYKKIIDRLLKEGVKLEDRNLRFSPHITVGRIKEKAKKVGVLRSGSCWIGELGGEFMAGRVTLYQSQLGAKGPKYTKLGEFEVK